ncbi:DUF2306 domain-containing protein [Telluribacter sp.]|jgi:hypothetical protein|uniref:DUF2306 domain-containing protein n=1 Tax=Telluribacter sp. TaxID=1978767 RepID=UPI002E0F1323|nr:DUF2306 domain-containing protein [Telluribacter sp.]
MKRTLTPPVAVQAQPSRLTKLGVVALRWSGTLLVTTVWASACLFGLYILAFYAAALYQDNMERWNEVLPGLYDKGSVATTSGIGLHFAMGGIILILGSIQLIGSIRERWPVVHRWIGRVYVLASLLAAVGGLLFIALKGTIGGLVMDLGFGLYGVLMLVAAMATYRYARAGQLEKHRAWALRLYALAIGSWLYRMDYGFWFFFTGGVGHADNFSGLFDNIMAFFFYIPNLLVAEAFIRARSYAASPALKIVASLVLLLATSFLVLGTYFFTLHYWGPAILKWVAST